MSFFDRFRAKWKHPDPAVREAAIPTLDDQNVLETLAETDPSEAVRLAAVQKLTNQDVLSRIARREGPLAAPAMKRLTDPAMIKAVALTSESRAAREIAIEKIDDGVTLHRIATSDTDPGVRLKARLKRMGPDQTRDYIRSELSKLKLAERKAEDVAGFCGNLDDVCTALIGDSRFRINGGIDSKIPGLATVRELGETVTSAGDASEQCAQFLAFKRTASGEPVDGATSNVFFEINVWRTDHDTYLCSAEEKRLKIIRDAVEWSRVSNGSTTGANSAKKSVRS